MVALSGSDEQSKYARFVVICEIILFLVVALHLVALAATDSRQRGPADAGGRDPALQPWPKPGGSRPADWRYHRAGYVLGSNPLGHVLARGRWD